MRSPWAAFIPSSDSLTKSSTALISFFTPASHDWLIVGTVRPRSPTIDCSSRSEAGASAGPTPAQDLVDPPPGPLDRLLPLGIARFALVLRPLRLERPVHLPVLAHLVQRGPVPGGQPGQIGRAQRGRLLDLGPDHRDPEDVGLELHEEVVLDRPAVDPQVLQALARV